MGDEAGAITVKSSVGSADTAVGGLRTRRGTVDTCACGRVLSEPPASVSAGDEYRTATVTRVRVHLAAQAGDAWSSRLVAEGGRHCHQLHAMAHNPRHPGVNCFAIGKWLRRAMTRADSTGISEAQALAFLEEHMT